MNASEPIPNSQPAQKSTAEGTPSLELGELLVKMAREGMGNAAVGLADMMGTTLTLTAPQVSLEAVSEIPEILGGPDNDAVGIYLQATGDFPGQILLVIPYANALELVDLLLGTPPGTTTELGNLERSALAEVGNLTGTFFLNAVASITGLDARPTPPAVMVDMVGAILDVIVANSGPLGDKVFMLRAGFTRDGQEVQANFWVVPDPSALTALMASGARNDH